MKKCRDTLIPFVFEYKTFRFASSVKGLNLIILGLASFWMIGSFLQMNLLVHCPKALGMTNTHYADASGLDGANRSTAEDLVRLLQAANRYPLIREATTRSELAVKPYPGGGAVPYRNTNPLVRNAGWQVELSKTGYVNEAGHCLAMQAQIAGRRYWIVLLDSVGKLTPVGDSNRLRKWIEAGLKGQSAQRG